MKPLLIGIAGASCSGKTTFVDAFVEKVGEEHVEVIHADDYWNKEFKPPIINGHKNRELPENIKFDLLCKHLMQIKNGGEVEIPFRVFEIKDNTKVAKPKKFVIVEGFLLFYYSQIRELFDIKVFFDITEEELVKRRIARNRSGKKDREEYYRTIVPNEYTRLGAPAKKIADLVLNSNSSLEANLNTLLRKIETF